MLGLDSAGKTTILYKLHLGEVIATTPTIGFNSEVVKFHKSSLSICDISGSNRWRRLWSSFFKSVNGLVFVIDAEDRESLAEAKKALDEVLESEEIRNVPLLVLGNKQDLPCAMPVSELVEKLQLFRIRDRHWHLQATCALSGEGLEQGFVRLLQMINNPRYS
jgi:ADP-ribosylation factor 1/2